MLKDVIESGFTPEAKARTITASYSKGANVKNLGTHRERTLVWLKPVQVGTVAKGMSGRVYSIDGKSIALKANGGGSGAKTGLYEISGCASRTFPRQKKPGVKREKQIEVRKDGKANTITSVAGDSMLYWKNYVRPLTPVECERLQSLPDNYTEGISKTQRVKALGNAFNVEVIKHILSNM
jgi:DNA (cytosine-5)-methyltransferase 3A